MTIYFNLHAFFHVLELYIYLQNQTSANPIRLLINTKVGGPMLVNFKKVPKTSQLLNNNNNNGVDLPINGESRTRGHFYRFMPYPMKICQNVDTYELTVSSIKLSLLCKHALHVFLHGLSHAITTHLQDADNTANYRFISKVNNLSHVDSIHEYYAFLLNSYSNILFIFSHHVIANSYSNVIFSCNIK